MCVRLGATAQPETAGKDSESEEEKRGGEVDKDLCFGKEERWKMEKKGSRRR